MRDCKLRKHDIKVILFKTKGSEIANEINISADDDCCHSSVKELFLIQSYFWDALLCTHLVPPSQCELIIFIFG